jgi:hypothetical protein
LKRTPIEVSLPLEANDREHTRSTPEYLAGAAPLPGSEPAARIARENSKVLGSDKSSFEDVGW